MPFFPKGSREPFKNRLYPTVKAKQGTKRKRKYEDDYQTKLSTALLVMQSVAEKKFHDQAINGGLFALNGLGVIQGLNFMAMGNTSITRVGKKINMTSLHLYGAVIVATTSTSFGYFRFRVVYDNQTNAATPVATDFLVSDDIDALPNTVNSKRFRTIWDKKYPIGSGSNSAPHSQIIDEYVSWKTNPYEVNYNTGNAGTVADVVSGGLWIVGWAEGIATTAVRAEMFSRIKFIDF